VVQEIVHLIAKEFRLEMRRKHALGGILLYVVSSVYIVYAGFFNIPKQSWNAIFWILMLFASINAVAKSFVQENSGSQLYLYQLAHPSAILLAKMIYNAGLLFLIGLLTFGVLSTFTGDQVRDTGMFIGFLALAAIGFSICFTFTAAIASKSNAGTGLLAILSFPVVIPILMSLVKLSANALGLIMDSSYFTDILNLLAIDAMMLALTFLLFPYLWRD